MAAAAHQAIHVTAQPDPRGNRVVISWTNPSDTQFIGTRLLRHPSRFPRIPGDFGTSFELLNDTSTGKGQSSQYLDAGLRAETVYYYAVVAQGTAGAYPVFVSAFATAPYQTADHLYRNLPEVYRLYDTVTPPPATGVAREDLQKGQLRRLVELLSQPFDLLRSSASTMRTFFDVDAVDGTLLPLLSQWIGHQTDFTIDLPQQRNEVRQAPHYYRTTGIAANLRAQINRLTNWDAHLKEFVHNVFQTSSPAELALWEIDRRGNTWQPARNVNLDVAYEGRAAALQTDDGRVWMFYHARQSVPRPSQDRFELFCKLEDLGQALPAIPLAFDPGINKHPAAVTLPGGSVWLFWANYRQIGTTLTPQINSQVLAAGRPAGLARITGGNPGPFALADGDLLRLTLDNSDGTITRNVRARAEQFQSLGSATSDEVAALLNGELPGVNASTTADGRIVLSTLEAGSAVVLRLPASPLTNALGLFTPAPVHGVDATVAVLTSAAGPFPLADGDRLTIRLDQDPPRTVVFGASDFSNIAAATADEVAAAITAKVPGVASVALGRVRLSSSREGGDSAIAVSVDSSTAAPKLGFGAPLPAAAPAIDDDEPSAVADNAGNVWLFWAGRRADNTWQIWYNRFAAASWSAAQRLTTGAAADREPFVVFDPSPPARLWVFWSRRKASGHWNIFFRNTANFPPLSIADWNPEQEMALPPSGADNRDPVAFVAGPGSLELFFASNRLDGWHVLTKTVAPVEGPETPVTTGQNTHRSPAVLSAEPQLLRLWFRGNDSQAYTSALYPASQTLDSRYSGSTFLDFRNATKLSLRGNIRDVQRYTYDTGKTQTNFYARDTVGVYLAPDTDDQQLILRHRHLFENALREFTPAAVRLVFFVDQVYSEAVYTYDLPGAASPQFIADRMVDTILSEVVPFNDSFDDRANVTFLRTFLPGHPPGLLPDLSASPPDLSFRLFTAGFREEA